MCANKTCSSAFTIPAPTRIRWKRPAYMKVIVAFTQAFQEAMDMRRAAPRSYLGDE
jgi:hypothetical protein